MSEIRTYEDAKQSELFSDTKYDNLMIESMKVISASSFGTDIDITDTPISPSSIEDDDMEVILSSEVTEEYEKLVEMINNPATASEYPIILLGKSKEAEGIKFYSVEKLIYCYDKTKSLNSRIVNYDEQMLNDAIQFATLNGYNFISLCHTHPNIPTEERKTTISSYLPQDLKEAEDIREAGLNISLQDFIQYESLYRFYQSHPNVRTFETIIMYNGEIAMFGKMNGEYRKMSNIYNGKTFDNIPVSLNKSKENENVL